MSRAMRLVTLPLLLAALAVLHPEARAEVFRVNAYFGNLENNQNDFPDQNPGDGVAEGTPGVGISSLRACIEEANAFRGHDIIEFVGGGEVRPINWYQVGQGFGLGNGPLPALTDPAGVTIRTNGVDVTINGENLQEFDPENANTLIDMENGFLLVLQSPNNIIEGLKFINSPNESIVLSGADVDGNPLPLPVTKNIIRGNTISAGRRHAIILKEGAFNNLIGGAFEGAGNFLISNGIPEPDFTKEPFEGFGVYITGPQTTGNVISGNFIGIDAAGARQPNTYNGLVIDGGAHDNIIGPSDVDLGLVPRDPEDNTCPPGVTCGPAFARNIISGNGVIGTGPNNPSTRHDSGLGDGVRITGATTINNIVRGNYVGANADGTASVPNGAFGIVLLDTKSNLIGGNREDTGNLVSGMLANIFSAGVGIVLSGAATQFNVIQGNYVGTTADGAASLQNWNGIDIGAGANKNIIGPTDEDIAAGMAEGARNVVSGNNDRGIELFQASNNIIRGNYVGLNSTGTAAVPNHDSGIAISRASSGNLIGGPLPEARNVISGNDDDGIVLFRGTGQPPSGNRIEGNFIGTDNTGRIAIGNQIMGVFITEGGVGNVVGVSVIESPPGSNNFVAAGAGNLISGNGVDGVRIAKPGTDGNRVSGNSIGVDVNGFPLPNLSRGVLIVESSQGNLVGGDIPGTANIISSNTTAGVEVNGQATISNAIRANSIYSNGDKGILLTFGGNTQLAAPELIGIFPVRGNTVPQATVDLFIDSVDEGEIYLVSATADANGFFSADADLAQYASKFVTATATDTSGNTSEFSLPLVLEPPTITSHPSSITVVEGEPWQLALTAEGTETIIYQWQYSSDGLSFQDIADGGGRTGTNTPAVQSSSALLDHAGFYRCIITNGIGGEVISASAELRVLPADLAIGTVNTLADRADGNVQSVAHIMAHPGPDGLVSLREMIIASNNSPGGNTIDFEVSGVIRPLTALPALTDNSGGTAIQGNKVISIDGGALEGDISGLVITSSGNLISGLTLVSFPKHGILISEASATSNEIKGCLIGTNGIAPFGNDDRGILVRNGASGNLIGGGDIADRNVISSNTGGGILFFGPGTTQNIVSGNYIGTDAAGRSVPAPQGFGVEIRGGASANTVGGNSVGERNIIGGNGIGVIITDDGTDANIVSGNYIGADVNGEPLAGNISHGVLIAAGASGNRIGGASAPERNLIAGNNRNGITLNGAATTGNQLRQNQAHTNGGDAIVLEDGANAPAVPPAN